MARALQVYLEDADFRALERWADERGWSLSQAVRVALKVLTGPSPSVEQDPLLSASGMVEGLPRDLSERLDHYLGLTFVAEPSIRYDAAHAPKKRRSRKRVR